MKKKQCNFMFFRVKLFLILFPLFSLNPKIFSRTGIGDMAVYDSNIPISNNDTVICGDQLQDTLQKIARFDHTENGSDYYYVVLSLFDSEFERLDFYKKASDRGIYIADKNDFFGDSALFRTTFDKEQALLEFRELYQSTEDANLSTSETVKRDIVRSSPFYKPAALWQSNGLNAPLGDTIVCSNASVACSENIYSFPAGITGSAPPSVDGYPNYGCLGSQPCPAWFYMQVSVAGDIIIFISQSDNHDVDFICWGPFTSLTDGCATGLTGDCPKPGNPCCNNTEPGCIYPKGNITDCSYSGASTETCHILNAQVGEIYILLITNFSTAPGTITFSQTGGTGVTNCNLVVHCSMIAITTNTSACDEATNTFSVSGNIEFSNPSPTGTLTITDNTAVPPVSQTFSPPFTSPLSYNLTNIPCDGATHFLTAAFSDSLTCNLTQQFPAPPTTCPLAQISGGGAICDDGISETTVNIYISGSPGPYNFTYAINGISQTPVTNYGGPMPFPISTKIPGLYSLVSVSNLVCPTGGIVSGSATVIVNPLPTAMIAGTTAVCQNSTASLITFTGASASPPYTFTYNINGLPDQTITTTIGNTVTVPAPTNTVGTFTYNLVSVQDGSSTTCSQPQTGSATVTVNPLPTATIAGTTALCQNATVPLITFTGGSATMPYTFTYNINGLPDQTITTTVGNTVTLPAPTNTVGTFTYNLVSVQDGSSTTCSQPQTGSATVTVMPLPVPVIAGPAIACVNTPGLQYYTEPGMSGYIWTINGGTFTTGATPDTINVIWTSTGLKNLTVNYTASNGCVAANPTVFYVDVSNLPVPTITIGPDNICIDIQTSYTTQTGMSGYVWTVSPDGSVTGGNTYKIDVTWNTPGTKQVSVNYQMGPGCTGAAPATKSVMVNQPTPPTITSPVNPICMNNGTSYTTQPGMSNYIWNVSPGGTFTSPIAGNIVNVTWNAPGPQYVDVNFTNTDGCIALVPFLYNVQVNPLPVTTITAGTGPDCELQQHVYQTPPDPACTFTWSANPGNVVSGQGTNLVTINWLTPGPAIVSVTGTYVTTTGCTSSSTFPTNVYPSPVLSFTPCFDQVTTKNAKPFILKGGLPLLGQYQGSPGITYDAVTGKYWFDPSSAAEGIHLITYYSQNSYGCSNTSSSVSITVLPSNVAFSCGTVFTDPRDNKQYSTVQIGTQCWMAENLDYGTEISSNQHQRDNCINEKYLNPGSSIQHPASVYQWDELMKYDNTAASQGYCPPGWHIPTEANWNTLFNFYISNGFAGSPLKYTGFSGFNALLDGVRFKNVSWNFLNFATIFWSSTSHGPYKAWAHGMNEQNPSVSFYPSARSNAFPVRCIKD